MLHLAGVGRTCGAEGSRPAWHCPDSGRTAAFQCNISLFRAAWEEESNICGCA